MIPRNDSSLPPSPPPSPVVPVNGSLRRQPSFYLPSREEVASVNRNGVESGDIPLAEGWRSAQPARSSVAREYGPCERSKSWPTSLPAFETFSSWRRSCVHVRVPRPSDGIKFSARCINIIPYRSLSLPKLSNGTESVSLHKFYSILFTRYFWRIGFSKSGKFEIYSLDPIAIANLPSPSTSSFLAIWMIAPIMRETRRISRNHLDVRFQSIDLFRFEEYSEKFIGTILIYFFPKGYK